MYCNKLTSKCDENFTKPCCKNHLIQVVHYLADLFDKEKIFYWMYFGTLLSAVRENGNIIPWDSDADLAITTSKQRFYALKDKIEADGYSWSVNHEYLIQVGYSEHNWTYCDIWLYDRVPSVEHGVGNNMSTDLDLAIPLDVEPIVGHEEILRCQTPWMQVNHTCDFPYWFVEEVEQLPFEGRLMNCPRNPKKFIEFLYGPGWNEPAEKDRSGYCGNYYPLSHWLDYVELQRELKQPRNILRSPYSPHCRIDTKKCKKSRDCCEVHKKEMIDFLLNIFSDNEIDFAIENNCFTLKAKKYDDVVCLSESITAYDVEILDDEINLYYSKINKNKIVIKFA